MEKKKSLGQHFLHASSYLKKITDAVKIVPGETVIEVGPGEGVLTELLLAAGGDVTAIEKDHRLIPLLQEKFKNKNFTVIEEDALRFDIPSHLRSRETYKLVGNIPYYITGALFKKFLSGRPQPTSMILLIQKEVAERIARSKKESILSLSVKAYGTPNYIQTVPRGAFSPPPNVDSAILTIEDISRERFTNTDHEKKFFELLHAGFAHKRKLLVRNLEAVLGANAASYVEKAGIPINARAEDIPLQKWMEISSF